MGFLGFIFTSIFVIWLLGQIGGFFLRRFVRRAQRNFEERYDPRTGYYRRWDDPQARGKEGDVRVSSASPDKKQVNSNVGDYVDFEEL